MLERAHVVQAVGQLDEHDADVVHHGQHHLAQVLGLLLFAGGEKSILLILVTPSTMCATCSPNSLRMSTIVTEVSSTESCSSPAAMATGSIFISASTQSDFEGMDQVRLAGGAALPGMILLGEFVGFLDELQIVVRPVGPHFFIRSRKRVTVRTLVAICWRRVAMLDYSLLGNRAEGVTGVVPGRALRNYYNAGP